MTFIMFVQFSVVKLNSSVDDFNKNSSPQFDAALNPMYNYHMPRMNQRNSYHGIPFLKYGKFSTGRKYPDGKNTGGLIDSTARQNLSLLFSRSLPGGSKDSQRPSSIAPERRGEYPANGVAEGSISVSP